MSSSLLKVLRDLAIAAHSIHSILVRQSGSACCVSSFRSIVTHIHPLSSFSPFLVRYAWKCDASDATTTDGSDDRSSVRPSVPAILGLLMEGADFSGEGRVGIEDESRKFSSPHSPVLGFHMAYRDGLKGGPQVP